MKTKFLIALVLSAMLTVNGCKKTISFDVHDTTTTVIKSSLASINLPFNLPIPTVTTSATEEFENQNIKPEWITNVFLKECQLTITSPADQDFDFLKEIHIYMQKSDGSEEQEIAYAVDIPKDAKTIKLQTTGVNLDKYLVEDSYKLRTQVSVNEVLTKDIELQIDLTFNITADVTKLF